MSLFKATTANDVLIGMQEGQNVNEIYNKLTPLHIACWNGNLDVVDALLNNGADFTYHDVFEKGAFQIAAKKGHLPIIKRLLQAGIDINIDINTWNATALYWACKAGHIDIVKYLVHSGASINSDEGCRQPLAAACENGHIEIVDFLLASGANVNIKSNEHYPLVIACIDGYSAILDKLIIHGAKIHNMALNYACAHDHVDIVRILLNQEPKLDINYPYDDYDLDLSGTSPLINAVYVGSIEIVKLLLDNGADINFRDWEGKTGLIHAVISQDIKMIKFLLNCGADEGINDNDHKPAIYYAGTNIKIFNLLKK